MTVEGTPRPALDDYLELLSTLASLLREVGEVPWAERVDACHRSGPSGPSVAEFLGYFGGMGSMNDLVPAGPSGATRLMPEGIARAPWSTSALNLVLGATFAAAKRLQEGASAASTDPLPLPYEAWHLRLEACPSCAARWTEPDELEGLVASRATWERARASLADGHPKELGEFDAAARSAPALRLRRSARQLAREEGWWPSGTPGAHSTSTRRTTVTPRPGPDQCPRCGHEGLDREEVRIVGEEENLRVSSRSATLNQDLDSTNVPPRVLHAFAGREGTSGAAPAPAASARPTDRNGPPYSDPSS